MNKENMICPNPLDKIKNLSTEDLQKLKRAINEELHDRWEKLPLMKLADEEKSQLNKLVLEHSPLPDLKNIDKPFHIMNVSKKTFISMVKGTEPNFTIFE
ncbi:MAG: hypothetical protein WBL21_06030, partial [Salinimicrobium sp.]